MSNFLSPYMYGDPNFRVPLPFNNSSNMSNFSKFIPFLGPAAGLINGFIGARGASRRQKLAIDNQWQMFQAQIKHQNEVNERAMAFQREMRRIAHFAGCFFVLDVQ